MRVDQSGHERRETYHDTQSSDSLPVGLDMTDETHVVIDVVLSERGREGILLTLISRPLLHHAETQKPLLQQTS